jgi:iron-sulfur cluster assembly accessory protein
MATVETREAAGVTLTEAAASKVRELMAQEPAGEAEVLRVAIQGGGCGGFEYQLGFDRGATAEDAEFDFHGVRMVIDPASAQYLKGATIDFVDTLKESGFKVDNPNASGSCGCGHSFHVADEEGGDEHEHVQGVPEHPAGCSH